MISERTFPHASRAIAFARHIPLGKLMRRLELTVRRCLRDHLALLCSANLRLSQLDRVTAPPLPLFAAPRACLAPIAAGEGWQFTFLQRSVHMEGPGVDWSAPGPGSAYQLWRMNLHYMEYLVGVDDEVWGRLVCNWIEANPQMKPGAWQDGWNSYALSLRVVVWLQDLARRAGRLPEDVVARAEASAVGQIMFLERNLETDLCGNHLIKNIKALIWASAYFAGPEAMRWRASGVDLLSRELDKQILADGMHNERSASYHAQVLADLLECRHALGGDPLGGRLDDSLRHMVQVTADLSHPDGGPALFNDSGLTMAHSPSACLAAYERVFGRRPELRSVFAMPDAGYYGLRSNVSYFVADCGRIAPDDLPAHGHGDVLSFEWSVAGERIIVDQGVYEYAAGERRHRARASSSHNTLCFEGADQADFFGAFRCGRRPNAEVLLYEAHGDGFTLEGTHDGFRILSGRPRHIRRFEARPRSVIISDRIEGNPPEPARIGFLLHPEVEVESTSNHVHLKRGRAVVLLSSTRPIGVEPAVWWPDMGVEIPTKRCVIRLAPGEPGVSTELQIAEKPLRVGAPR